MAHFRTTKTSLSMPSKQTCYNIDENRNAYQKLLNGESVSFNGIGEATYDISHRDFCKNNTKMIIVNPYILSIVTMDEKRCDYELKKLENLMKKERTRVISTGEVKKRVEDTKNSIERIKRAKLKSRGVGMLCELEMCLSEHLQCPGCEDEFPCCDPKCKYSKTLLSIVERTDSNENYSDDEEESDLNTEESINEEYDSSEYSSFDDYMMGKSQESDDADNSDEDYYSS